MVRKRSRRRSCRARGLLTAGSLGTTSTTRFGYPSADTVTAPAYAPAGNPLIVGISTSTYNALGWLTSGSTGYAQDLVSGQSHVLAATTGGTTADYLYRQERLAATSGGTRTWYGTDGQGSVRQLLNDAGHAMAGWNYDPYGQVEAGGAFTAAAGSFGYTGELTDAATGSQYLRARWYQPGTGQLLGVDPAGL